MNIILLTGILSLIIQIITGVFDAYVLNLQINDSLRLLVDLLWMEFGVQIVEGIFYIWMIFNFSNINHITPFRYLDWFITTPVMLITYSAYLIFMKNKYSEIENKSENKSENKTNNNSNDNLRLSNVVSSNFKILAGIVILNGLMLLSGLLGELGIIPIFWATVIGFIPFIAYFGLIYFKFAQYFTFGKITFIFFFGAWTLYGIASFLSYKTKNVMFNILDLFSKNFFGIFIAGLILYYNNIIKTQR